MPNVSAGIYAEADQDRLGFWAAAARRLSWAQDFTEVLDWSNPPFARWFADGKLNVAYNCVDRHVENGRGDKVASTSWASPATPATSPTPSSRTRSAGPPTRSSGWASEPGDRVAIYLPMIPEAVVAMLACARIGAAAHRGLRRLLRRRAGQPGRRLRGQARHHRRRRLPAGQGVRAQARGGRGRGQAGRRQPGRARAGGPAHRRATSAWNDATRHVVARAGRRGARPSTSRRRSTPSTRCSSCTPRAPPGSPRASCTPAAAT